MLIHKRSDQTSSSVRIMALRVLTQSHQTGGLLERTAGTKKPLQIHKRWDTGETHEGDHGWDRQGGQDETQQQPTIGEANAASRCAYFLEMLPSCDDLTHCSQLPQDSSRTDRLTESVSSFTAACMKFQIYPSTKPNLHLCFKECEILSGTGPGSDLTGVVTQ